MHILSAQELVYTWEVGLRQHPLDRALTILMATFPGVSRDTLALLSVGQRDACLLTVRQQLFGSRLASRATCPACLEKIEFVLDAAKMQSEVNNQPVDGRQIITVDTCEIQFRLPNSLDQAAIVGCRDTASARTLLLRRCVVQVVLDGVEMSVERLPEALINELTVCMEERDPLAEIRIALDCPACGHHWQVLFDIVSFFWLEMCAQVKRLLREVHILAQAYSWREADILAMSPARRQLYLEMVT
jgi:hypothetical protein